MHFLLLESGPACWFQAHFLVFLFFIHKLHATYQELRKIAQVFYLNSPWTNPPLPIRMYPISGPMLLSGLLYLLLTLGISNSFRLSRTAPSCQNQQKEEMVCRSFWTKLQGPFPHRDQEHPSCHPNQKINPINTIKREAALK